MDTDIFGTKKGIGADLSNSLQETIKKGKLAASLQQLLCLDDSRLEIIMDPIKCLADSVKKQPIDEKAGEQLRWLSGVYSELIEMVKDGEMDEETLETFIRLQRSQLKAAQYLPKPFCDSQQVMGAITMMAKICCQRLTHDLPNIGIKWQRCLGKPVGSHDEFLKKYPFMMPIAFSGEDWIKKIAEHPRQYYGRYPAFCKKASIEYLLAASEKWPLENIYAFCPMPKLGDDATFKEFLLEKLTWPEQQHQLQNLQRKYPYMKVRFAHLHELAFIDLSLRSGTLNSPMEILSFHCQNPSDESKCLLYGRVDQNGAEIIDDQDPNKFEGEVLPLFIVESKEDKD